MSFKIEKITNAYLMEIGAEKSVDFGKAWDTIHVTFDSVGNEGDTMRSRDGFIAGVLGPEHQRQHKALFEKCGNVYEICLYEWGTPQRMEITYLHGKASDPQYAQRDIARIAGIVNQVVEKDAALKLVKQP